MSDLDPKARAIIEAGRAADVPSRADHDRIKRAVLLQIAVSAAVAGTASAGTLSVAAKAGLAVLAVTLVGGGTVGLLGLRARDASAPPRAQVAPAPRRAAPTAAAGLPVEPVAPPAPLVEPIPAEEAVKKVERARKAIVASGKTEKAAELDQLDAEVEVLKRAREDLRQRRPARALEALGEYDRRFGKGVLAQERQAMAAIAACQVAPGAAARAQAEAFLRQAPASPLRERVREACITPVAGFSP